jgi:hypothetical protein
VALVRTDVSEEPGASFIRVTRIGESVLVAACVVPSSPILVTLMKEAPGSSETSVLTRATLRSNPEDTKVMEFISILEGDAGGKGSLRNVRRQFPTLLNCHDFPILLSA